MPAPPSPLTGRCLCGGVTYTVDAEPIAQAVCHCSECQRQTSSPFSVVVGVPHAALQVEGDTLASFNTVSEASGGETTRHFCSGCGSPLFSLSAGTPEIAWLKAGSLDDSSWLEPNVEVWTRSAQPWTPRPEVAASFERVPG